MLVTLDNILKTLESLSFLFRFLFPLAQLYLAVITISTQVAIAILAAWYAKETQKLRVNNESQAQDFRRQIELNREEITLLSRQLETSNQQLDIFRQQLEFSRQQAHLSITPYLIPKILEEDPISLSHNIMGTLTIDGEQVDARIIMDLMKLMRDATRSVLYICKVKNYSNIIATDVGVFIHNPESQEFHVGFPKIDILLDGQSCYFAIDRAASTRESIERIIQGVYDCEPASISLDFELQTGSDYIILIYRNIEGVVVCKKRSYSFIDSSLIHMECINIHPRITPLVRT